MNAEHGVYLYPRIHDSIARALVAEMADTGPAELLSWGRLDHAEAAPNATGGRPATKEKLEAVQTLVRDLAQDFGFPGRMSISNQAEFDRICGTLLHREMAIVPADAGHKQVWSFLTVVLLPEIAPWRFPERSEDRLLGGIRNMFQRLWWRAWSLGPDLTYVPEGCQPFGEDEYFQVMERPSLAGNQRVAHGIQAVIWESGQLESAVQRAVLLRALVKRVRAERSHICFDSLDSEQLLAVLRGLRAESISFLTPVV